MKPKVFSIGGKKLSPLRPLIMGALNVTPDSFSDGGKFSHKTAAVRRAFKMIEEGADIVDVGGESSRPGARPVPEKEELRRVIPVIEAVRKKSAIPISIDTTKAAVAEAALAAGATLINDIGGFRDPAMMAVAARRKAPVVVMHMRGDPRTMQKNPRYKDVVAEVCAWLARQCAALEKEGVTKIIVDPGIGFGKTAAHNVALLAGFSHIASLGYPALLGASRKSFIGAITGAAVEDRLPGTLAAHLWGGLAGASIVRVHDVAAHRQAFDILMEVRGDAPLRPKYR
ncbi:MAG: dihydropteroate synthase [Nitrospinae bacterium]|nr:dihydropteroate synthase [Nitrospinota bacterium]